MEAAMKRAWAIGVIVTVIGGGGMLTAQSSRSLDVQMKAAEQKANVQGDLAGAIEDYKKIVAAAGAGRAVVAQALVRMGECYQKLGDTESRRIYERVVREYADQAEAVKVARARLDHKSAGLNGGVVTRQVWSGPDVDAYGTVSPDGRLISFTDWTTGELALHDLVTGRNRTVTSKRGWESMEFADGSTISRDGRLIAYTWTIARVAPGADAFSEVRVIDANGGKPRVLFSNRDSAHRDVARIAPMDWSPDGKWLAVSIGKKDGTADTALLSTGDGTVRVLKSHRDCDGHDCGRRLLFSPDGRYLAYDWAPKGGADPNRQIHVIAAGAGSDTPLLEHAANDRVLGWSPDGKYLMFASDRSGVSGVWAVAVIDGRAHGEPQLVRANIAPNPLGITRAGALYYAVGNPSRDVYVADMDVVAGRVLAAPAIIPKPYVGINDFPRWSPDGMSLAYLSQRNPNSRSSQLDALLIRSMDSGQVRELHPRLRYFNYLNIGPLWTRDGSALIVNAFDVDGAGRQGIYRVDARSGEARALILSEPSQGTEGNVVARALSPDGNTLYISRNPMGLPPSEEIMLARDLSSGREREIARRARQWGRGFSLSPDGRWIVRAAIDQSNQDTTITHLMLYPVEGGAPRELLRASSPDVIIGSFVMFTSDGKSVVFAKGTRKTPTEIWQISVDGSGARKNDFTAEWAARLADPGTTSTSIHPDGHHVAFATGGNELEIWAMENILAAVKAGQ
jgi:Tol biopolymer transport system component